MPHLQQPQSLHEQELTRIEMMEKELSNVLERAGHGNYETLYNIYSNIINNAELASRQIDNADPVKRLWYKKVLEFQIKEKKFRENLEKQYRFQSIPDDSPNKHNREQLKSSAL